MSIQGGEDRMEEIQLGCQALHACPNTTQILGISL